MTREEFLAQLRASLQGKVSSDHVQENMDYYNSYIIEETRKGKNEQEVLEMLGDPALIAKAIIAAEDAGKQQKKAVYDQYEEESSAGDGQNESRAGFGYSGGRIHMTTFGKWWQKLLAILVVVMILLFIVAVVSGLIRIFAPIFVPLLVIAIVVRAFGRRQ